MKLALILVWVVVWTVVFFTVLWPSRPWRYTGETPWQNLKGALSVLRKGPSR